MKCSLSTGNVLHASQKEMKELLNPDRYIGTQ